MPPLPEIDDIHSFIGESKLIGTIQNIRAAPIAMSEYPEKSSKAAMCK